MGWLFILFFGFIIVALAFGLKPKEAVVSNWRHSFPSVQFSSQEFYESVQKVIESQEIPGITFSRVHYIEKHFLGAKREYLRIIRDNYAFDICAAPFGKGFFVSYWFVERKNVLKAISELVMKKYQPNLAAEGDVKTYYQWDTEAMFQGAVHSCVLEAIGEFTTGKGLRELSELERMPIDRTRR